MDQRTYDRRQAHEPIPHETFTKLLYRQPSLTEEEVYPEPYRAHELYHYMHQNKEEQEPRGSLSIDIEDLTSHEETCDNNVLFNYFNDFVIPLAQEGEELMKRSKLLGVKSTRNEKVEIQVDRDEEEVVNPMAMMNSPPTRSRR